MMNSEEVKQIDDYLILNKLPLDILLEVRDHMISQISDFQIKENLSFEQAFFRTKIAWEDEFRMTRYSIFFAEEIPAVVKKIVKARFKNLFTKSLYLGFISLLVNFVLIYFSENKSIYLELFRLYNSIFVLTPFIVWIFHPSMRKYVNVNFKYQGKLFYTMYQQNLILYVLCANTFFQVVIRENYSAFLYFRTENFINLFSVFFSFILPFILQIIIIFVLLNFIEHKKSIAKIQNFIKISEAN